MADFHLATCTQLSQSNSIESAMEIKEFLSSTQAVIGLRAPDKDSLLRELSQRAAATVRLDADSISSEVLKRERLGSTGIGRGVAIPHARINGLKRPFGILARLKSAIDFDAIDDRPVDIVFLLLLPVEIEGEHITALASVSRILRDAETVGKLRQSTDNADIYRAITEKR